MSGIKREMERLESLDAQAVSVAERAGALRECELHSGELIYGGDPDADARAYAMGTNSWKNGDVDGTRDEFMDAIKSAFENASDGSCARCNNLMRRDD